MRGRKTVQRRSTSEFRVMRQPCALAAFAGGRFSPSSNGNQELVNGAARVVRPEAGCSETNAPTPLTNSTAYNVHHACSPLPGPV